MERAEDNIIEPVQPVLIVNGYNEMDSLYFLRENSLRYSDILITHEYQRIHLDTIRSYINPEYYRRCPARRSYKRMMKKINKSGYKNFYMYFLVKYLQQNNYKKKDFKYWLKNNQKLYVKTRKVNILRHFDLKKSYNTIIISLKQYDGNYWNRFYSLPPNYWSEILLRNILNHLNEEGYIIFLNGKLARQLEYASIGYRKIEEKVYQKLPTPRKKFKHPRMGL